MPLYESIMIIRQDVSSADVDSLVAKFQEIIEAHEGKVVKNEYWGLRSLAYEIQKNKKGHYVLLGIEAPFEAISEFQRRAKLSEDVLRNVVVNVEEISKEPSPILRTKSASDIEVTIDVTSHVK